MPMPSAAENPPMWDWYNEFYAATRWSRAYAAFCERVYGANFAQHGFADMAQLARLLEVTALGPANRVLDLGCGNGSMAGYISDTTGAHVTGIDYVPDAISQAQERTRGKQHRLAFCVGNMDRLDFPAGSFDTLIAIDTLYFTALDATIPQMKLLLAPGGQMGVFYSHGAEPGVPVETFPRDSLRPDNTPLANALQQNHLRFRTWDFTAADYQHAQRMKQVMAELRAEFEAEGHLFLYENRHAEAEGVMRACEAGVHARYLYHVK